MEYLKVREKENPASSYHHFKSREINGLLHSWGGDEEMKRHDSSSILNDLLAGAMLAVIANQIGLNDLQIVYVLLGVYGIKHAYEYVHKKIQHSHAERKKDKELAKQKEFFKLMDAYHHHKSNQDLEG